MSYNNSGLYEYLANNLIPNLNSLEIGCGAGFSSLQIAKISNNFISIDENPNAIENAFQYLQNNGISIQKILRGKLDVNNELFVYKKEYSPFEDKIHKNNLLLEGDILVDNKLHSFLKNQNISNIICWLMGGHQYLLNEVSQIQKGRNGINGIRQPKMVSDYKFDVIDKIAELANSILSKSGVISIAERIGYDYIDKIDVEELISPFMTTFQRHGFQLSQPVKIKEIDNNSFVKLTNPINHPSLPNFGVFSMVLKKV